MHNLQELYGALKGYGKKGAGMRKSFVQAIETPEYALHSDDHEDLIDAALHKKEDDHSYNDVTARLRC